MTIKIWSIPKKFIVSSAGLFRNRSQPRGKVLQATYCGECTSHLYESTVTKKRETDTRNRLNGSDRLVSRDFGLATERWDEPADRRQFGIDPAGAPIPGKVPAEKYRG
jgi:hypothetical protein